MTCSHLLCDCIWLISWTKGCSWPSISGKLLHRFKTREANPRQTCGGRVEPRLDSLFEQSRLLSKLKHTSKPALEGSLSSMLNHHMLKCSDLSAQRHQLPQGETQRSTTGTKPWKTPYSQALLEWWILLLCTHIHLLEAQIPAGEDRESPCSAPVWPACHLKSAAESGGSE